MTKYRTRYTHHCRILAWGLTLLKTLLFKSMNNTHSPGPKLRDTESSKFQLCLSAKKEILMFKCATLSITLKFKSRDEYKGY